MFELFGPSVRRCLVHTAAIAMCVMSVLGATASAQTTLTLNQANQVTDTTIRSGAYANTNHDGQPLLTRASASDPQWLRRALIKFDTANTISAGADIVSATLTVTVRSGLGTAGATRPVHAYRVPIGFLEDEATWNTRMGSSRWASPGGDMAERVATANVTNRAGTRVSFDVTAMVRQVVNGAYDTRYTRLVLLDAGADAKESYREYYSAEDSSASRRPTLTVVRGTSSPSGGSTSQTLKVLQWNISQGYGTDGQSNISRVVDFIVQTRPDVISFNEIMRYSGSSQPQQIADALRARTGQTWSYYWVQKSGAASGEGECVMTRFPIEAQDGELLSYDRSIAMARVNVNGRNIHVFSTHLDHQSSARRLTQVREVVNWSNNFAEQRIVAGDFNGWPGTAEIIEMLRTHHDGWAVALSAGDALAYASNPDGNTRNTRIDFVFHSRGATALRVTRAQVYDTRNSAGHRPSDHNPLIVTYQVQ
jgi:endonuclease/exonuclease/phosphatase family metal-dependent hydrolase